MTARFRFSWSLLPGLSTLVLPGLLLLAGCSGEAGDSAGKEAIPPNPYLSPESLGPYLVGNHSIFVEDPSRELDCGEGNRTLLTELWYPAQESARTLPEQGAHDFFLGRWDEVVAAMGGDEEAMLDLPTGSYRDAELSDEVPAMPIIYFSHGFQSTRFQGYTLSVWLASHGFLVVAPDHPCDAVVTLGPDAVIPGVDVDPLAVLPERVLDLLLVMDLMERDPPVFLQGRLDTARVGLMGHSYGGVTLLEVLKSDTRARAILPMAAFGFPPTPKELELASMHVWGLEDKIMGTFETWHYESISSLPLPRYQLEFPDTGHFAFSDLCLFIPAMAGENGCGTETRVDSKELFTNPEHDVLHEALGAYATAFFGGFLAEEDALLDWFDENHYPELMSFIAEE